MCVGVGGFGGTREWTELCVIEGRLKPTSPSGLRADQQIQTMRPSKSPNTHIYTGILI